MFEAPVAGRTIARAFVWLFAALAMVSLLSPPGATHDEWFHASSIWCAQGVREPYCQQVGVIQDLGFGAVTNLNALNCQRPAGQVLFCPVETDKATFFMANYGLYPKLFYLTMSFFVMPSVEGSIVAMRIVNTAIITAVIGTAMWLLPNRHRLVLFLLSLSTFASTGYFLFASINPSSWTAIGIGTGWLLFHAALSPPNVGRKRRIGLILFGCLASIMAVGSRWDSVAFLGLAMVLAILHCASLRFTRRKRELALAVVTLTSLFLLCVELITPLSPLQNVKLLFKYSEGQPDNLAFLSYQLLQGVPNALAALGSVPSMSSILLPDLVYVVSLVMLGLLVVSTVNRYSVLQSSGALVVASAIGVSIAIQVAVNDFRDVGAIEPRYSYPLLLVGVAWWFLLGPADLESCTKRYVRPFAIIATFAFALTMFTVAERYVDRQTYGIRYLPESPDQWWWTWLPFGPNVPVLLAPICLWMYFRTFIRTPEFSKR